MLLYLRMYFNFFWDAGRDNVANRHARISREVAETPHLHWLSISRLLLS
jgi:hypothetical protein